jgi:hypothetical protein
MSDMDASKVAEEVSLHVFGELGTLFRRDAIGREDVRDTPLECRVLEAAQRVHQGRLCEKLLLRDQLGRDADYHTALDDHFPLAPGRGVWQ